MDTTVKTAEDTELRHSLRSIKKFLEILPSGVILVDQQGHICAINTSAESMFRYARQELIGKTIEMLLQDAQRDRHRVYRKQFLESPSTRLMGPGREFIVRRKDGSLFALQVGLSPVRTRQGMYVLATVTDITERKREEEKIRRLNRLYAMLSGINALIVRERDRQELFSETCRIAVETGGYGIVWIDAVDPETLALTPAAAAGSDLTNFTHMKSAIEDFPQYQGAIGRVLRVRKPVFVNDLGADMECGIPNERRREAHRLGYRSMISLPIMAENNLVGIFTLLSREVDFFTEDEIRHLTEMAGDISFALDYLGKTEKLDYLAYYDSLTGLPNRTLLHDYIDRAVRRAEREKIRLAVLMCDVNRFRNVNETLGRHTGDLLLRELAQRLQKVWPESDYLGRVDADRFAGILENVKDTSEIADLVKQPLSDAMSIPFEVGDKELRVAITAGIALFPEDGKDADTLLKNAEAAVKKAKKGGERYLFYQPQMNAAIGEILALENKLRKAVEDEQFLLHYQPKINLATWQISGFEALIRWNDPDSGLIPPAKFIPLLEETGLILEVGAWVIRKALADYHALYIQGLQPRRIAVNVSSIQLRQTDFVEVISQTIKHSKALPHGLDLEITESMIMDDIKENIGKLNAIHDMGVNIAIDDFGTGYSSLAYLARLPVDMLKIDRSFILAMTNDADSMAIVSTIISLAHSLNLKVIAEGVETKEQIRFLSLLKCDEIQGYVFSKPLSVEQLTSLLDEHMAGKQTAESDSYIVK